MTDVTTCTRIGTIKTVKHAKQRICDACVTIGARWVHLRTCQACETTLCCDSSPNRHASAHARATSHAVVASARARGAVALLLSRRDVRGVLTSHQETEAITPQRRGPRSLQA